MLRIGIAGIGFMGWIHWLTYQKNPEATVAAICEKNPRRQSGDWTDINGNFGPPGQQVDLSDVEVLSDLDQLCSADVDIIDICLPPWLHTTAIEKGLSAGKHVFCEKPLALNSTDCDRMIRLCESTEQQLLVGHVLPFFPEYAAALELISSGDYGQLVAGSFKRIISDPIWLPDFYDAEKIGGPLFDLHVHDAHFVRLIAGNPESVNSCGSMRGDVVDFCHSVFQYPRQGPAIATSTGTIRQPGRPFTHGFEILLDEATLQFEFAALSSGDESMPLKVIRADGTVELIPIENSDPTVAFENEIEHVLQCVNDGRHSEMLDARLARDAIRICEAEAESVRSRASVSV